jgi:hypothetical protein
MTIDIDQAHGNSFSPNLDDLPSSLYVDDQYRPKIAAWHS